MLQGLTPSRAGGGTRSIEGLIPAGETTVYSKQTRYTYYHPVTQKLYHKDEFSWLMHASLGKRKAVMDEFFSIANPKYTDSQIETKSSEKVIMFPGATASG